MCVCVCVCVGDHVLATFPSIMNGRCFDGEIMHVYVCVSVYVCECVWCVCIWLWVIACWLHLVRL